MSQPVPFVDLRRTLAPVDTQLRAAFDRVLGHARFVLGPEVADYEAALARYVGLPHAVGVSSGTDALLATFLALDLPPGSDVLLTPFTFISTATSVLRAGLRPVFVDLPADGFHPEAADFERAWTDQTRAVAVVHLYGQALPLDDLAALCRKRGAALVEDCAQAIGARHADGRHVGSHGVAGTFSFFPAKNLGALGDGGAVVTADEALDRQVRAVRQHGCKIHYRYDRLGGNFRLDALQAALLGVLLPQLDGWLQRRRDNAAHYARALGPLSRDRPDQLRLPVIEAGHACNQYVVRSTRRDALAAALKQAEIGHAIYYPSSLHIHPALAAARPEGVFPNTERCCAEVLALPIYPGLRADERERVVEVVTRTLS